MAVVKRRAVGEGLDGPRHAVQLHVLTQLGQDQDEACVYVLVCECRYLWGGRGKGGGQSCVRL